MNIGGISLNAVIAVVFGGIICASVYTYYTKKVLGDVIRRLFEKGIDSAENAVTLEELGYSKAFAAIIGISFKDGASVRRYIGAKYSADEAAVLREERGQGQRYFLIPEKAEIALERYNGKNMTFGKLIAGIAVSVAAAIVCALVFPYLIGMIKGTGEIFKVDDGVTGTHIEETVVSRAENQDKTDTDK